MDVDWSWILTEEIDVTLVHAFETTGVAVVLVSGATPRHALTLTMTEERTLVNGIDVDLSDDYSAILGILDAASEQPVGETIHLEADADMKIPYTADMMRQDLEPFRDDDIPQVFIPDGHGGGAYYEITTVSPMRHSDGTTSPVVECGKVNSSC